MTELYLPPAEEVERLKAKVDELYQILEGMSIILSKHDQYISHIGNYLVQQKESNARESNTGLNGIDRQESGSGDAGTSAALPD